MSASDALTDLRMASDRIREEQALAANTNRPVDMRARLALAAARVEEAKEQLQAYEHERLVR